MIPVNTKKAVNDISIGVSKKATNKTARNNAKRNTNASSSVYF